MNSNCYCSSLTDCKCNWIKWISFCNFNQCFLFIILNVKDGYVMYWWSHDRNGLSWPKNIIMTATQAIPACKYSRLCISDISDKTCIIYIIKVFLSNFFVFTYFSFFFFSDDCPLKYIQVIKWKTLRYSQRVSSFYFFVPVTFSQKFFCRFYWNF